MRGHTTFVRKFFSRMATLGVLAVVLSACATPPAPQFPELRYSHMSPITLGVAEIKIVDAETSTLNGTHVESRMPQSPAQAMRAWAEDRLRASGVSGVAIFTIEEATTVGTDLKPMGGVKGAFTTEQLERYDARVRATLRLEGVPRVSEAFAQAGVDRSQTLSENATINDREQMWFDLTEAVMKDFDPAMEASIRKHLADFVR